MYTAELVYHDSHTHLDGMVSYCYVHDIIL